MVLIPLSLRTAVKGRLQAVRRNVPRPAAAAAYDIYMRRQFFNLFEMPRLELCNDSEVNSKYMSGTLDSVCKPSRSKKKDHVIGRTLKSLLCIFVRMSDWGRSMGWMKASRSCCSCAKNVFWVLSFCKQPGSVTLLDSNYIYCGEATDAMCAHGNYVFDCGHISSFWIF